MNISDTVTSLAHDVSSRAQDVAHAASSIAHDAAHTASSKAQDAAHAAGGLGRHAVDVGRSNLQSAGILPKPKRRSPWAALFTIALVAGLTFVSLKLMRKGSNGGGSPAAAPRPATADRSSTNGATDAPATSPERVA